MAFTSRRDWFSGICSVLSTDFFIYSLGWAITIGKISSGAAQDYINVSSALGILFGWFDSDYKTNRSYDIATRLIAGLGAVSHVAANYHGRHKQVIRQLTSMTTCLPGSCFPRISLDILSEEERAEFIGMKTPGIMTFARYFMLVFGVGGSFICVFIASLSGGTKMTKIIYEAGATVLDWLMPVAEMMSTTMLMSTTTTSTTMPTSIPTTMPGTVPPTTQLPDNLFWLLLPFGFALCGALMFLIIQGPRAVANAEQKALLFYLWKKKNKEYRNSVSWPTFLYDSAKMQGEFLSSVVIFCLQVVCVPALILLGILIFFADWRRHGLDHARGHGLALLTQEAVLRRVGIVLVIALLINTWASGAFTMANALNEISWTRALICGAILDKTLCLDRLTNFGLGSQSSNLGTTAIGRADIVFESVGKLIAPPDEDAEGEPEASALEESNNNPEQKTCCINKGRVFSKTIGWLIIYNMVDEFIQGFASNFKFLLNLGFDGYKYWSNEDHLKAIGVYRYLYVMAFSVLMVVREINAWEFTNKEAHLQSKLICGDNAEPFEDHEFWIIKDRFIRTLRLFRESRERDEAAEAAAAAAAHPAGIAGRSGSTERTPILNGNGSREISRAGGLNQGINDNEDLRAIQTQQMEAGFIAPQHTTSASQRYNTQMSNMRYVNRPS